MRSNSNVAISLVSIGVVFASSQAIKAQSTHTKWGEMAPWVIMINPDVGNGCYMENTFEDGTTVQVGFVPDRNGGFFAAYNAAWTNVEDGATGTVEFDFEKSLFRGEYVGVANDEKFGGYAFFNNPEFIKEFGKRNTVVIKGDKGNAFDISLKGTTKAINAARNCDAEQPK